jgi:hypothetical protein
MQSPRYHLMSPTRGFPLPELKARAHGCSTTGAFNAGLIQIQTVASCGSSENVSFLILRGLVLSDWNASAGVGKTFLS